MKSGRWELVFVGVALCAAGCRSAPDGPAQIIFTIADGDSHQPMPSRVIFRPPPAAGFADSTGVVGSPEGVLLSNGTGRVSIPAGDYQLFITRGPEYEAVDLNLHLATGERLPVTSELAHTVDTRGWLSADLHVHTLGSNDSRLPPDKRIVTMTTNGVEVVVSTEHDASSDLAPTIAGLGYGADVIGSVIGEEFNFDPGHGGAYPVPYDPKKVAGGVPTWITPCPGPGIQCAPATEAFDRMHALIPSTTVVTINHPWWITSDLGWFTNVPWGAGTQNDLPAELPATNFDALEVLNGYMLRDVAIEALMTDWFYLLGRGHRITALGSSDTHKIDWVRAGWPRSWLRLANDRPGDTTGAGLADAIRHQRAIASTGPFATLDVDGAQIGDTVIPATPGQITVQITVDAPSWIGVDEVRLFVDGQVKETFTVAPGQRPLFATTLTEAVRADAWLVLMASGSTPLPADVVGEYSSYYGFQMMPFVVTNPVFVDADGDGQWKPSASSASFRLRPEAPERALMPLLFPDSLADRRRP